MWIYRPLCVLCDVKFSVMSSGQAGMMWGVLSRPEGLGKDGERKGVYTYTWEVNSYGVW